MSSDSKNEPQPAAPTAAAKRRLSPLMFVFLVVAGLAVLLGVFVAIMMPGGQKPSVRKALQEIRLPDGTILALEAVTWGKFHEHEVEFAPQGFSFSPKVYRDRLSLPIREDEAVVLWFSHRDASGRALDFAWWSHAAVVDSAENEMRDLDTEAGQFVAHPQETSSYRGRPFPVPGPPYPGRENRLILACAALPTIRHDGDTFPVRMYDRSGNVVAEFQVKDPSPTNGRYPVWKPEELPITREVDGLSVTLTRLTGEIRELRGTRNGQPIVGEYRRGLRYDFQLEENGTKIIQPNGIPRGRWNAGSLYVKDAFGHAGYDSDIKRLALTEPAWKLSTRFYRNTAEEYFDESELWTVKDVEVPAAGQKKLIQEKAERLGVNLELIAAGGSGTVKYQGLLPSGTEHDRADRSCFIGSGDDRTEVSYEVSFNRKGDPANTIFVNCRLPHIMIRWSRDQPLKQISKIHASDGQGHELYLLGPVPHFAGGSPEIYFITRPPESTVKDPIRKISFTFAVNIPRSFEFLVKPPEFKPRQPPPRSLEQQLAISKRNITRFGEIRDSKPDDAQFNNALSWAIVTAPQSLRTPEQTQKGLECARLAVNAEPESRNYANTLAMVLLRAGNFGDAVAQFEKNLAQNQQDSVSLLDLYGLALAQFHAGDSAKARATRTKALAARKKRLTALRDVEWHETHELGEELQTLLGDK